MVRPASSPGALIELEQDPALATLVRNWDFSLALVPSSATVGAVLFSKDNSRSQHLSIVFMVYMAEGLDRYKSRALSHPVWLKRGWSNLGSNRNLSTDPFAVYEAPVHQWIAGCQVPRWNPDDNRMESEFRMGRAGTRGRQQEQRTVEFSWGIGSVWFDAVTREALRFLYYSKPTKLPGLRPITRLITAHQST